MKNKKGFTLVELMIVIGIAAILAVISIPSVMKWYKKDQFIQQTREIIDMINDARTNAITEKKCSDGNSSEEWYVFINKKLINLICIPKNAGQKITEKAISLDKNIKYKSDYIFYKADKLSPNWQQVSINELSPFFYTKPNISFLSGINNSFIDMNLSGLLYPILDKYDVKKIQIPFVFTEDESVKRTICFDRIAGFPTMSLTEECDD